MSFQAKILADSISVADVRLTTFQVTFPRFILAEFNTHRVFSRNSASSRAIPLKKQISMLMDDGFVPDAWPTEQKGMSGGEPLAGLPEAWARAVWVLAQQNAIESAERLAELNVHKSLCNRLLEPFMWHTAICTATEWDNFFALRTAEDAQPEFRRIAVLMQQLHENHVPRRLGDDERHLPLVTEAEIGCETDTVGNWEFWTKVSAGRCCRVSYLTHDGVRDPQADVELHDRLLNNGHMSPLEHQAWPKPLNDIEEEFWSNNFYGWTQYRATIPYQNNFAEAIKAKER